MKHNYKFRIDEPAPTDEQIKAFYDEHKERVYTPDFVGGVELPSPTPGFKTPRRMTLQYAKADFKTVVDGLLDTVMEKDAIGKASERVMKRQLFKLGDLRRAIGIITQANDTNPIIVRAAAG